MTDPKTSKKVISRKLLLRLQAKGIIREPPEEERPQQPSKRRWGTSRGYHYVQLCETTPSTFSFEGSTYTAVTDSHGRMRLFSEPTHPQP